MASSMTASDHGGTQYIAISCGMAPTNLRCGLFHGNIQEVIFCEVTYHLLFDNQNPQMTIVNKVLDQGEFNLAQ